MSEEQLKAAETEAKAEVEESVEEISEEDLGGVAGGVGCAAIGNKPLPADVAFSAGASVINILST